MSLMVWGAKGFRSFNKRLIRGGANSVGPSPQELAPLFKHLFEQCELDRRNTHFRCSCLQALCAHGHTKGR